MQVCSYHGDSLAAILILHHIKPFFSLDYHKVMWEIWAVSALAPSKPSKMLDLVHNLLSVAT